MTNFSQVLPSKTYQGYYNIEDNAWHDINENQETLSIYVNNQFSEYQLIKLKIPMPTEQAAESKIEKIDIQFTIKEASLIPNVEGENTIIVAFASVEDVLPKDSIERMNTNGPYYNSIGAGWISKLVNINEQITINLYLDALGKELWQNSGTLYIYLLPWIYNYTDNSYYDINIDFTRDLTVMAQYNS